jgi:hypothetical protein
MKDRKVNGNTATLIFSVKGLEILNHERRVQMNTMEMELTYLLYGTTALEEL